MAAGLFWSRFRVVVSGPDLEVMIPMKGPALPGSLRTSPL
jgi:hypothetical protein